MAREQQWLSAGVGRLAALGLAVLIGLTSGLGFLGPDASASAQPRSPRETCIVGDTPGQRIDNIIAILIGYLDDTDVVQAFEGFAERCPGAAVLPYLEQDNVSTFLGVPPDELWNGYQNNGQSLTEMAVWMDIDRTALLGFLSELYRDLIGRALADGALNEGQGQRVEERVIPQFGWLVDYRTGDPILGVGVAGGDVNGDRAADVIANCVPGDDPTAQTDNLIKLMLGLPVTVDAGRGDDTLSVRCGSVEVLGLLELRDGTSNTIMFGESPDAVYQEYLAGGMNLLAVAEENGVDPVVALDTWEHALKEALDAEVEAGRLTVEERERIEAQASLIIVVCLKHYHGDPLPNDFTNTTLDDEAAGE